MVRISNKILIEELMKNSRVPYTKLAEKFRVSEAAIRKRIRALIKRRIIIRFTVEVDYKTLGYTVAWVGVDTSPEKYLHVIERLKEIDGIRSIFSSTGDHMIMLEAISKGQSELNVLIKRIESIEGVTRVCPAILVERIK